MAPGVGGERLGNDPLPVVQGHAHRRGRGIKTHHKHVAQPSGRAVWLSQTAELVQRGLGRLGERQGGRGQLGL